MYCFTVERVSKRYASGRRAVADKLHAEQARQRAHVVVRHILQTFNLGIIC